MKANPPRHSSPSSAPWELGDDVPTAVVRLPQLQPLTSPQRSQWLLGCTLGLSLLLHGAVFSLAVSVDLLTLMFPEPAMSTPPTTHLAFIELTPESESAPTPDETTEIQRLQAFRATTLERAAALEQALASAVNQQTQTTFAHQQQLSTLATAQTALSGQLETLAVEKADLAARLASERQRATELERQLHEARQAKERELVGVKTAYDRLVTALQGEISQKEIALRQAKEQLVVTILDRVLFPSGQATLTPEGRRVLAKVGAVLTKVADRRVLIEGHTDNVPIGATLAARFPTNWELSTARATEVVRFLIAEGELPAAILSAVGRADTTPVASNASEDGRKLNRRIEIIVLPPDDHAADLS
jgi:chemotaxis protein MotB